MTPASATIRRWREDERGILQFTHEQFGVTPDAWQEEALLAVASTKPEHQRIALQACVGPGKTAVLAWAGCWFLGVQGDAQDHPQGACVAITGDNLRDNLWKEYAKWIGRSRYMAAAFTWTAKRIFANDHPETWFLSARSWPQQANSEVQGSTLSGLHSRYVLCQADESGAIPMAIMRAGEQALSQASGGFAKFLQAGNPISLEGMLYAAATQLRHLWHLIRITGDPDDPKAWVHNPRVGKAPREWAEQQIKAYGRNDPWVKSRVLGMFPPASINQLFSLEDVEAAMHRHQREDAYSWAQKRIGVDVARFGDDLTVIFPRQGLAAFWPVAMRQVRTTAVAGRIVQGIIAWTKGDGEVPQSFVDDSGHWGHGVIDNLIDGGYPAVPVIYSDPSTNPRYRNVRAQNYWLMADWVKEGGVLPAVQDLVGELTAQTYTFVGGKIQLEDKDQIKERLGRSPNYADALSNTFHFPDMPSGLVQKLRGQGKAARDADPYN